MLPASSGSPDRCRLGERWPTRARWEPISLTMIASASRRFSQLLHLEVGRHVFSQHHGVRGSMTKRKPGVRLRSHHQGGSHRGLCQRCIRSRSEPGYSCTWDRFLCWASRCRGRTCCIAQTRSASASRPGAALETASVSWRASSRPQSRSPPAPPSAGVLEPSRHSTSPDAIKVRARSCSPGL